MAWYVILLSSVLLFIVLQACYQCLISPTVLLVSWLDGEFVELISAVVVKFLGEIYFKKKKFLGERGIPSRGRKLRNSWKSLSGIGGIVLLYQRGIWGVCGYVESISNQCT